MFEPKSRLGIGDDRDVTSTSLSMAVCGEPKFWGVSERLIDKFEQGGFNMRLEIEQIIRVFQEILRRSTSGNTTVGVLSAVDLDAICAVRVLKGILQSEHIFYRIECVQQSDQLQRKIEQLRQTQIRVFVLVNCGSFTDLSLTWVAQPQNDAIVFILDSRRPVSHANVNTVNIVVVDQGQSNMHLCPSPQQIQLRRGLLQSQVEQGGEQIASESGEAESQQVNKVIKSRKQAKDLQQIEKKLIEYYSGEHFVMGATYMLFRLAKDTNKLNNDIIWLAAVALTWQMQTGRLCAELYEQLRQSLRSQVQKTNLEGQRGMDQPVGNIKSSIEFNFCLMRHWSLIQSMRNSVYIVKSFRLWRDNFKQELNLTLAKMGYSIQQASQNYAFMKLAQKNRLKAQLKQLGEEKGLYQLIYQSFVRKLDTHLFVSTSDVVYLLAVIINSPASEHDRRFWNALQALQNYQKLMQNLQKAKNFQQNLIKACVAALESKQVIRTPAFCYYHFKPDSLLRKAFAHPFAQMALGHCLMDFYNTQRKLKDRKKKVGQLPMVVVMDLSIEQIRVVGVVRSGQVGARNWLGRRFSQTCQQQGLKVRQNYLQQSVVQLQKTSLNRFISRLNI